MRYIWIGLLIFFSAFDSFCGDTHHTSPPIRAPLFEGMVLDCAHACLAGEMFRVLRSNFIKLVMSMTGDSPSDEQIGEFEVALAQSRLANLSVAHLAQFRWRNERGVATFLSNRINFAAPKGRSLEELRASFQLGPLRGQSMSDVVHLLREGGYQVLRDSPDKPIHYWGKELGDGHTLVVAIELSEAPSATAMASKLLVPNTLFNARGNFPPDDPGIQWISDDGMRLPDSSLAAAELIYDIDRLDQMTTPLCENQFLSTVVAVKAGLREKEVNELALARFREWWEAPSATYAKSTLEKYLGVIAWATGIQPDLRTMDPMNRARVHFLVGQKAQFKGRREKKTYIPGELERVLYQLGSIRGLKAEILERILVEQGYAIARRMLYRRIDQGYLVVHIMPTFTSPAPYIARKEFVPTRFFNPTRYQATNAIKFDDDGVVSKATVDIKLR
jgi:hypothetical protein